MKLRSIVFRKKPGYVKGHAHEIFSDLLKRDFRAESPDKIWCVDFTYIPITDGSMRYNCTILDLFRREVVASVTGKEITAELAIKTLNTALRGRYTTDLIIHSDQGSQFTSKAFVEYCKSRNVKQSMSRAGCPYDNAVMERYFNTLKNELINQYYFKDENILSQMINDFAFRWYNKERPHSYNGGEPPVKAKNRA